MEQQDSFQAAIDYLIANRKKPVFTNRGLFTEPAQETKPSVMSGLFGDDYIRKPQGGDSGGFEQPFTGNPYSGKGLFGTPTYNDIAEGLARQGALERNRDNLSRTGGAIGQLFQMAVPGAMFAKYAVPFINNQINDYQYGRYLEDQDARAAQVAATQAALGGQVGTYSDSDGSIGTFSNQAMIDAYDRATFGITGAEMDASRGIVVGGPIDTSLIQGTSIYGGEPGVGIDSGNFDSGGGGYGSTGVSDGYGYSGPSSDYGQSGAANDRD